jgi:hypothetical protein
LPQQATQRCNCAVRAVDAIVAVDAIIAVGAVAPGGGAAGPAGAGSAAVAEAGCSSSSGIVEAISQTRREVDVAARPVMKWCYRKLKEASRTFTSDATGTRQEAPVHVYRIQV